MVYKFSFPSPPFLVSVVISLLPTMLNIGDGMRDAGCGMCWLFDCVWCVCVVCVVCGFDFLGGGPGSEVVGVEFFVLLYC